MAEHWFPRRQSSHGFQGDGRPQSTLHAVSTKNINFTEFCNPFGILVDYQRLKDSPGIRACKPLILSQNLIGFAILDSCLRYFAEKYQSRARSVLSHSHHPQYE